MKILETQNAVLSNYEVLTHLNDVQARYKDHPDYKHRTIKDFKGDSKQVVGKLNGLRLVVGDTLRYLSGPDSCLTQPNSTYSSDSFRDLMTRLSKYNLTKSEVLMIFNLRPKDAMALDVIVEEADDRFTEEQQEEILAAVGDVLGRSEEEEEEEEEKAEEA